MNDKDIPRIRKEIEERLAVYTKNDLNEALAYQKAKMIELIKKRLLYKSDLDGCYHTIGKKVDLKEFDNL